MLGGRRVPVTGRARGDVPDIAHPLLSVEVKERATLPKWLGEAMSQAVASAAPGQLPAVVLHERGQCFDDALVLVPLGAFVAGVLPGLGRPPQCD